MKKNYKLLRYANKPIVTIKKKAENENQMYDALLFGTFFSSGGTVVTLGDSVVAVVTPSVESVVFKLFRLKTR